jgi:hypothetical protein
MRTHLVELNVLAFLLDPANLLTRIAPSQHVHLLPVLAFRLHANWRFEFLQATPARRHIIQLVAAQLKADASDT